MIGSKARTRQVIYFQVQEILRPQMSSSLAGTLAASIADRAVETLERSGLLGGLERFQSEVAEWGNRTGATVTLELRSNEPPTAKELGEGLLFLLGLASNQGIDLYTEAQRALAVRKG